MSMTELLRGAMKRRDAVKTLDSTGEAPELAGADNYTIADITMSAVSAVQQWAETDDLDDGESYADRLMALMVGIADANKDGDITEDEQGVLEVALNAAWDYLVKCGATEEDAGALLNDWDDEAADRVRDLVASVLPEGDDESSAEIDNFVFSDSDQEPALDAGPDFSLGDGRYSDYLDGASDIPTAVASVEIGEVGGDVWHIRHLTGAMAESIERMTGEVEGISGRLHWLLGGMACQMVRAGESVPDASDGEGAFDEFLVGRMRVMAAFPESDFASLMTKYMEGRNKLHHLFRIEFTSDGIVAMPKGGAASNLPPARFPANTCLSGMARELVGKPHESGV